ncbi:MAG TPA: FAD-binding protein [Candidatus Limnocylindria bacterium]|nr:FAD-binding protein [Candidatus Limnocylindria bacterium]
MGVATHVEGLTGRVLDGLSPSRTVRPASTDELAQVIGDADRARRAVVLWGGGTRIGVGDPPDRYDIAVDLTGLAGVVEHSPADLVCTVRAGTSLATLAEALRASGQRWPVEAPAPERATVGGTIASAAVGPSRLRYQHPRDWIIGCVAVLGDGTITRAGGRVVKNVTGYDLTRLYSGSYGTLVAIAELTLKLAVLPERSVTLRVPSADIRTAMRTCADLRATHLPLDALAVVNGDAAIRLGESRACVFVRVAGQHAAVERVAQTVRERTGAVPFDAPVWDRLTSLPATFDTVARASWPAGHDLPVGLDLSNALLYPGSGIAFLLGAMAVEPFSAAREAIERAEGALVVERGDPAFKRAVGGAWGRPRVPLAIARGLKDRFDPRGVLAPGRIPLASKT